MKTTKQKLSDYLLGLILILSAIFIIAVIALQSWHVISKPFGLMAVAAKGSLRMSALRAGLIVKEGSFIGNKVDLLRVTPGEKVKEGQEIALSSSGKPLQSPINGIVYFNVREPISTSLDQALSKLQSGGFPTEKSTLAFISQDNFKLLIKDLPWHVEIGNTIELKPLFKETTFKTTVSERVKYNDSEYLVLQGEFYTLELLAWPWYLFMIESEPLEGIIISKDYLRSEEGKYYVRVLKRGRTNSHEVEIVGSRGSNYVIKGIEYDEYLLPWKIF